jgi:hypothetical protein
MLPYNEKIWCVDLSTVSSEWCHGRVPEAPLDDVIKGALGFDSEGYTHQLAFYYPRRGGSKHLFTRSRAGSSRAFAPQPQCASSSRTSAASK